MHCARTFEGKQATINSGFVVVAQRGRRGVTWSGRNSENIHSPCVPGEGDVHEREYEVWYSSYVCIIYTMCVCVYDPRENEKPESLLPLAVGIAVTSYIVAIEMPRHRGRERRRARRKGPQVPARDLLVDEGDTKKGTEARWREG